MNVIEMTFHFRQFQIHYYLQNRLLNSQLFHIIFLSLLLLLIVSDLFNHLKRKEISTLSLTSNLIKSKRFFVVDVGIGAH